MNVEIKILDFENGYSSGTFTEWLKAVGENVIEGEAIAEFMTEKANVEVPSPATGILEEQFVQSDDAISGETILGIVRTS